MSVQSQAESVEREARERLQRIEDLEVAYAAAGSDARTIPTPAATRDYHLARLREVFGPDFRVLPRFSAANASDLSQGFGASDALQGGNPLEVVRWFQRLARVRAGAARLDAALMYAEVLGGDTLRFTVGQLPYAGADDRWLALPLTKPLPPGGRVSVAAHAPRSIDPSRPLAGLLVDEWVEVVPSTEETTGLTFQLEEPRARPPQAILLAVPPDGRDAWDLDTLEATLLETLELAKLRAVDLTTLSGEIGQYLPALYFAHNPDANATVSTDFSRSNGTRDERG
jgi:hypothetical protein